MAISQPSTDLRQPVLADKPWATPWNAHDTDFFAVLASRDGANKDCAGEKPSMSPAPSKKDSTPETQSPRSLGASDGSGSASESPWCRAQSKDTCPPGLELPAPQEKGRLRRRKTSAKGSPPPPPPPGLEPLVSAPAGPTLVQVFKALRQEDPACIIKLRKVQPLGQRPKFAIWNHFQKQVAIKQVHVVYSQMKVFVKGDLSVRCKPTGMAFLVLQRPEEARLLSRTAEHTVDGVAVVLEAFKDLEATPSTTTSGDGLAPASKGEVPEIQLAIEARFSF